MKINFDKKKSAETLSGIVQGTVDVSKKVAESAKNNVSVIVEKTKSNNYLRKMKKYNPLFPEQYQSEHFKLPNMIMIVDDAVRRDIDVCEGAIGWLGNDAGVEILYLYDEAVEFSNLKFVPVAACDALYYVDNFDRTRFIKTDCIFSKAHEERLAELKHIAYSLGAKHCSIEICESVAGSQSKRKITSVGETFKGVKTHEEMEQSYSSLDADNRSGLVEIDFNPKETVERPKLKWFANDDTINRLIDMCCDGNRSVKAERLELAGSSSATMSQKVACAIDSAMGKMGGVSGQTSMDAQASKEHHSKLVFVINFE